MEAPPVPLFPHPLLILASHSVLAWQLRTSGISSRDGDGLELEERKRRAVVWDAHEGERWVRDVEDVFVEIMRLRAIGDEDVRVCGGNGGRVVVE